MKQQTVVLCRCPESKGLFGIRLDYLEGRWKAAWSFKLRESTAKREGFGNNHITYTGEYTEEFPGCPYCGSKYFVLCGMCDKLTCDTPDVTTTCGWCGNTGVKEYVPELSFRSGEM